MPSRSSITFVALAGAALAVMPAFAQTLKLCGQSVDSTLTLPASDVPDPLRQFSGVWIGSVAYNATASMCMAFVIHTVTTNGSVMTRYAYNRAAETGVQNIRPIWGVSNWTGKITGENLHFVDSNKNPVDLRLIAPNRMEGTYGSASGAKWPITLTRR
jgi:hypothetical protein